VSGATDDSGTLLTNSTGYVTVAITGAASGAVLAATQIPYNSTPGSFLITLTAADLPAGDKLTFTIQAAQASNHANIYRTWTIIATDDGGLGS
jgi:hypothetical protein